MSGKVTTYPPSACALSRAGYCISASYFKPSCFLTPSTVPFLSLSNASGVWRFPVQLDSQVRALAGSECGSLRRKPPLELAALRRRIINNFVYVWRNSFAGFAEAELEAGAGYPWHA